MTPILRIHPADNAIVALRDLDAATAVSLDGQSRTLREKIPAKQKFAAKDFAMGDMVTMYGVLVGKTTQAVPAGALLHTHNLKHASATFAGKQSAYSWTPPDVSKWKTRTFKGFKRPQGPAGTAYHWIVIPLVFCENRNLGFMREALVRELVAEVSVVEDLHNYAISRIHLDNFAHLKAYWPMIGRTTAQLSLAFGVNDIDGTIDDSTKNYTMAGSEEQTPSLTTENWLI